MIITQVKEAAIYRNGAYITRLGNIELKKGKQTIEIDTLSDKLDPSTLTLALNEKVKGSNIRVNFRTPEQQSELKKDLTDSLNKVKEQIAIYSEQIEILKKNTDFSNKESISLKEMGEYIDALPEKLAKINDHLTKLKKEEEDLNKELTKRSKKVRSYIVQADLECEEDGVYPLRLRSYESSASWTPFYEIHTGEEEKASVRLRAKIRQNSLEDWKQIKIKLYTGDPSISADIPLLDPRHLSFYQPSPIFGGARAAKMSAPANGMMMMEETMAMDVAEAEEELIEVRYDEASASRSDTMMEYELNGTYDLDNVNEITLDLTSHDVDCRYHIIAVPKADNFGYLAAEVKTQDIQEVLNSPANIFHKETFLGNFFLSPDQNKDTYDISLGRDESIRLKRQQTRKYRSNVLLKGQTKEEQAYELEISSLKDKSCSITLIDQIPVSDDKTIIVDIDEISNAKLDEKTGELKWEFDLQPNEKRTFKIAYTISWPKDKTLYI